MKRNRLRLRLVVRRHGLPDARVIFNVSLDDDPTISKLLEQINDTLPLESGDWGLEDYAVEVRAVDGVAFECLHFQPVESVLKEDEEVIVRPLLSQDLKRRRLSGRHQISSDGKHLIDGVPFGRPLLKRPRDRPTVHISPRKRLRLTYNGEGDDDDLGDDGQSSPLLLTEHGEADAAVENELAVRVSADFDDADDSEDHYSEFSEAEVEIDGAESDDLASAISEDELRELREDAEQSEPTNRGPSPAVRGGLLTSPSPSILDLPTLDKITALRGAFPTATIQDIEHCLRRCRGNERKTYRMLEQSHPSALNLEDTLVFQNSLEPKSPPPRATRRSSAGHEAKKQKGGREVGHDDVQINTLSVRAADQGGIHDLALGEMISNVSAGKARQSPFVVDTTRLPSNHTIPGVSDEDDETSSDEPTSDSASDSDSDSDSGIEPENSTLPLLRSVEDRDDDEDTSTSPDDETSSSSDGSNDGSSDSAPEFAPAGCQETRGTSSRVTSSSPSSSDAEDDTSEEDTSSSGNSSSDESSSDDEPSVQPASRKQNSSQMSTSSTANPRSRPDVKEINGGHTSANETKDQRMEHGEEAQREGLPGHGISRTRNRNARRRAARKAREQPATVGSSSPHDEVRGTAGSNEPDLEQRKQALLDVVAATQNQESPPEGDATLRAPEAAESYEPTQSVTGSPSQLRTRIDLGAGRRLLFGALGLRNPKTKADEDKLRANLMNDVRPLVNHRLASDSTPQREGTDQGNVQHAQAVLDDDPEAWRDKITYSAVECCHDGVELSEPPFPFVQRWDPQQQGVRREGKSRRGGRGKRKERNQEDFYEADSYGPPKKRRLESSVDNNQMARSWLDEQAEEHNTPVLNYDDQDSIADPAVGESQFTDVDDLPSLPQDLSVLPSLRVGEATAGMVITWKQWLLSTATSWQPLLSNLTAVIVNAGDDGTVLRVLLSRRDRVLDRTEKQFDSVTGQRVYDRFEAPDLDIAEDQDTSAQEGLEEGFRDLQFCDLIEPRIVQRPVGTLLSLEDDEPSSVVLDTQRQTNSSTKPQESSSIANEEVMADGEEPTTKKDSLVPGTITRSSPDAEGAVVPSSTALDNKGTDDSQPASTAQLTSGSAVSDSAGLQGVASLGAHDGLNQDEPNTILPNELSELSSPSRQLELEDMLDAVAHSSHQVSREISRQPTPASHGPTTKLDTKVQYPPASRQTDDAKSPTANVPPSATSSIHSGRQPDLDCGIDPDETSQALDEDASRAQQLDTPRPAKDESTTAKPNPAEPSAPLSTASSSPLPSVSDLWLTASASRSTQSPAKSAAFSKMKSRKPSAPDDLEYKEVMRRLDEGVSKSDMVEVSDGAEVKVKDLDTQSLVKLDGITSFRKSVSPPALAAKRRRSSPRPSSQFSIPDGSQVISLLSSSPEPEVVGNRAENGIDVADSALRTLRRAARGSSQMQQDDVGGERAKRTGSSGAGTASAKRAVSTSRASLKFVSPPSLPAPNQETTRQRRARKSAIKG